MKKELLKHLVCPYTKEPLKLSEAVYGKGNEIKSGVLTSSPSKNKYHIINYIPVMLKDFKSETSKNEMKRYDGWAYEWMHREFEYNTKEGDIGVDRENIEQEYKLKNIDFKNKIVFEAGCGGGRITSALHRTEAKEYFMMDISEAVYEARKKHQHLKNAHFIRGDITYPPFNLESIDIILCIAVVQHAENPQKAIIGMSDVLKKEGIMAISHYMWPKNLFVRLKVYNLEVIRRLIKWLHIPNWFVMAFTRLSVFSYRYILLRPLAWFLFTIPPVKEVRENKKEIAEKIIWQNNFDAYNPGTYQHWKTEKQTQIMLLKAGLVPILETRVFPNAYVCIKKI
ncbi:MAG: class I SAM-dependent methyltransferase [Candidatus Nanoarchaeia archaeon]